MEFEIIHIEEIKGFAVFEKGKDDCLFSGKKKDCKKHIEILPTIIEDFFELLKTNKHYEVERILAEKYNIHISEASNVYRYIIQEVLFKEYLEEMKKEDSRNEN